MGNVTYVRWRAGESRRGQVIDSLDNDHPMQGTPCLICNAPLGEDGPVQLLALGPAPDDQEARDSHDGGRWYTAEAVVLGEPCLAGMSDEEVEELVAELVAAGDEALER